MVNAVSCREVSKAGAAAKLGAIIVYPTDTVYAVGSIPSIESSVKKCFELKRRGKNPMPILFSSLKEVVKVVSFNPLAKLLANAFWPGPLTMVLPLREDAQISPLLTGNEKTLGVRIPNHNCCRELLEMSGGSLIGTSANISGENSAFDCDDSRLIEFAKGADIFVRGKCGSNAVASTVIDVSGASVVFVREGQLSKKTITSYLEKTSRADLSTSNLTS